MASTPASSASRTAAVAMILDDGDGPVEFRPGVPRLVVLRHTAGLKPGPLTPRTPLSLARLGLVVTAAGYAEPESPAHPLGLFLAAVSNLGAAPVTIAQGTHLGHAFP